MIDNISTRSKKLKTMTGEGTMKDWCWQQKRGSAVPAGPGADSGGVGGQGWGPGRTGKRDLSRLPNIAQTIN
jgi:hypothetical protein